MAVCGQVRFGWLGLAGWVLFLFCFVSFRLVSFAGFLVESPTRCDGPGPISALSRPRFGVVAVRSRDDSRTAQPMAGAERPVDAFDAHGRFLVYLGGCRYWLRCGGNFVLFLATAADWFAQELGREFRVSWLGPLLLLAVSAALAWLKGQMTLPRDVRKRRVLVCNEVEAGPFQHSDRFGPHSRIRPRPSLYAHRPIVYYQVPTQSSPSFSKEETKSLLKIFQL